MLRGMRWLVLFVGLVACSKPRAVEPKVAVDPELARRLAVLEGKLEAAREEQHVPGMALAIVKDGQVVYAKGFGVRDLDTKEPVTPDTVFAIGSTTKAFTATAIGTLVDEGTMAWDEPLATHLPELTLQTDRPVTVRDALTHRTGFPRMTLLILGNLSAGSMWAYASKAVPVAKVGEKWQYNNLMYAAAGAAAGNAAGMSWSELVRARLLRPLGMNDTYFDPMAAGATGRFATGYTWKRVRGRFERETPRDIKAAGPAGAIHSSVLDMATWLRLQLGGGEVDGKRVVAAATLAEIHKDQMEMAPGAHYTLGWMSMPWNGKRHLAHGGNIDGFAAQVGFAPDDGVGYVLLTNESANQVTSMVGPMVLDAMLTEGYGLPGADAGVDVSLYVGEYDALFPPFEGQVFEVVVKDGALAVDVPGQTVYELKPPDDQGRWYFAVTDTIHVTFAMGADGKAAVLEMHQAGLRLELPRVGTPVVVEVDAAEVAPLLGRYAFDDGSTATVLIHRGRLAVDVPGQMIYELFPPEDGRYKLRAKPEYYLVFEDGAVVFHQDGREARARRAADPGAAVVTIDSVRAVRQPETRAAAVTKLGRCVAPGVVKIPSSGLEGAFVQEWQGRDRYRFDLDLGEVATMQLVVTPTSAFTRSSFDDADLAEGAELTAARSQHPLAYVDDWSAYFSEVQLVGAEGDTRAAVRLVNADVPPTTVWVDLGSGDVVKAELRDINLPAVRKEVAFDDFRDVGGVRMPFVQTTDDPGLGPIEVHLTEVTCGLPPDDARFPARPE